MKPDLKIDDHRAIIDQAFKETYEAVEETKVLIRRQTEDSTVLMDAADNIEGRLDRVEMAMTMLHGDILELNTIVQELQAQRDEAIKLIRRMAGKM